MPSREEERFRNLKDKKLRYHNGNYEKYCDRGWPIKHGWFILSQGCIKCNPISRIKAPQTKEKTINALTSKDIEKLMHD
jgi:hypothetical protein